jgi:hypothetical protein
MEKRVKNRCRKRLMIKYGKDKAERTAFTRNVSPTGLFIQTNLVYQPGTTIQIELRFPDRTFSMWARVIRAKRVPAELARVLDCGMGVEFIDSTPEWREFFVRWSGIDLESE